MRQVVRAVTLALMAASLGACAARDSGGDPGLSRSGVQVYGEMDVGVGAVRQSR